MSEFLSHSHTKVVISVKFYLENRSKAQQPEETTCRNKMFLCSKYRVYLGYTQGHFLHPSYFCATDSKIQSWIFSDNCSSMLNVLVFGSDSLIIFLMSLLPWKRFSTHFLFQLTQGKWRQIDGLSL